MPAAPPPKLSVRTTNVSLPRGESVLSLASAAVTWASVLVTSPAVQFSVLVLSPVAEPVDSGRRIPTATSPARKPLVLLKELPIALATTSLLGSGFGGRIGGASHSLIGRSSIRPPGNTRNRLGSSAALSGSRSRRAACASADNTGVGPPSRATPGVPNNASASALVRTTRRLDGAAATRPASALAAACCRPESAASGISPINTSGGNTTDTWPPYCSMMRRACCHWMPVPFSRTTEVAEEACGAARPP